MVHALPLHCLYVSHLSLVDSSLRELGLETDNAEAETACMSGLLLWDFKCVNTWSEKVLNIDESRKSLIEDCAAGPVYAST